MKRSIKNIIMSLIIILTIGSMVFTMNYAKKNVKVTNSEQSMTNGETPSMNNNQTSSDGNSNNQNSSDNNQMQQPSSDNNTSGTPPSKPEENSSESTTNTNSDSNNMGTPPTKPEENSSNSNQMTDTTGNDTMGQPPTKPDNDTSSNNNQNIQPQMPSNKLELSYGYYIAFGVEGFVLAIVLMYLVMSRFNKKDFKETFKSSDKVIINVLAIIIITAGIAYLDSMITENCFIKNSSIQMNKDSNNTVSVNASGTKEIDGTTETISDDIEATEADQSTIVVKNNGKATINGATLTKSSGDSSNTENSEFYGINAGILVTKNSEATIKKSTITTSAKGSNAVFATGENAKVYVSDTTIETTGESSSRGLDATYGGYIEADNVKIKTIGGSCATLATDRGEGTVIVKNSTLETNGSGSPVIYSTGDIQINNTEGIANGSQMVVIEGKNSATVTNSNLEASGKGNRGDIDQAGVMIYQSMSGDASEGTGTFTAKNSTLKIDKDSNYYKSAPMFFITNTKALINLENTKLKYGSNTLLSIKGTNEWGNTNSNGGDTTLKATNQELVGNIEVDKISTLTLNLTKSTYKGTINKDNSAKEINIKLDKKSKITLTGDSYVTSLEDADTSYSNINFNGYKLYVNGKAIN